MQLSAHFLKDSFRLSYSFLNKATAIFAFFYFFLFNTHQGIAETNYQMGHEDSLKVSSMMLPVFFEKNMGQWQEDIHFTSRTEGLNIMFYDASIVYQLFRFDKAIVDDSMSNRNAHILNIRISFKEASPNVYIKGSKQTNCNINRFYGNDSSKWISNIPSYEEVIYTNLYPGIDMKYFARKNQIKYDLIVHPQGNLQDVTMKYDGIKKLEISEEGLLLIHTDQGLIKESIPETYQIIDGKKAILNLSYYLIDNQTVGFILPETYDKTEDIIIDPSLIYSTFIGGGGDDNSVFCDLVKDNLGNIYTCGQSTSVNFPVTAGSFDVTNGGNYDCVVYKLNPTGTGLVYATYLGGVDWDCANSIAIDKNTNDLCVIGSSQSYNFPVTAGAFQTVWGGGSIFDIVVFKLNSTGSALIFSTYLGGEYNDQGHVIKIDSLGYIYGTGQTVYDFPVTPGAYQITEAGGWEACFFKMNPTGSALVFSSYFGGPGIDRGGGIAFDNNNNIYLHGMTEGGIPVSPGAFQTTYGGGTNDSFVAKFSPDGSTLIYSTLLGGSGNDYMRCQIVVDNDGYAYVTGLCQAGFPVTSGAYDVTFNGGTSDVYVTKVNQNGTGLVFSTFLGGSGADIGWRLTINDNHEVYVTGQCSSGFPTTICSYDNTFNGSTSDAFLAKLNANGSQLLYSTFIGGSSTEYGNGIAEENDTVYLTGFTSSSNFPVTSGSFDVAYNGGTNDMFVLKLSLAPFDYQISPDTTICPGSSIILTATGGTSYAWSTSETTNAITVAPSTNSTYTVTITNGGCSVVRQISVTISHVLAINVGDTAICQGETAVLTATGANSFLWSTGENSSSISVAPSATTLYTVTGTLGACTSTNSVTVNVNNPPMVTATSASICPGFTTTLSANGADNYEWSNGGSTNTITVSPSISTSYTVTGTSLGCSASALSTVTILPTPLLSVNNPTICQGSFALISASGADSYLWSNLSTDSSITVNPISSTSYSVTGTLGSCTASILATVTVIPLPSIYVNNPSVCEGSSATLTASGADTYYWNTGATGDSITVAPSSTTFYSVTGTASGCTSSTTASVTVINYPIVSTSNSSICPGSSTTLFATGADSYEWNIGDTSNSITVSPSVTTSYTVTGTTQGCSASNISIVTILPIPLLSVNNPTICQGSSATITASGAESYIWSNSSTDSSITVTPASSTMYSVTGTLGTCTASTIATITVIPLPSISVNNPSICEGSTATLAASGADSYYWSTGASGNSITVSPHSTTTYSVTGTVSGCTSSTLAVISVYPRPLVSLGTDTTVCNSDTILLNPGIYSSYLWQDGTNAQIFQVTISGFYSVTVTNSGGCMDSDTIQISLLHTPTLEFGSGTILCDNAPMVLNGGGDGSWTYIWQDYSANQYYTVTKPGLYVLTVSNICGAAEDSILFTPCPDCIVELPTAFSPNGDGINDFFHILGGGLSQVTFLIYDRFGKKIFETSDPSAGWDGMYKGVMQENEVYFYYLAATCLNGQQIEKKGDLTLIR